MRYASLCSKACRFSIWFSCSCFVYKDLKAGAFAISRYFSWLEDIYKDLPHLDQKGYLWQQLIQVFAYLFPSLSKSLYKKKKACLHHTCDILALLEIRGEKKKKTNPVCLFTDKLKIQELFYIPMQKAKILNIYLFLLKSFCCPKVPSIECLEYMWTKSWMGKT